MSVLRPARRIPALIGVSLLALGLGACTTSGRPAVNPAPTVEQSGPAGPVPAGLDSFYGQSLTWGECAPYATSADATQVFGGSGLQCARLRVPLDYAHPEGAAISIGVLRHRAEDRASRIGALVVNPGGPGASGMVAAAALSARSHGELSRRLDIVGFDPRGVGASEPQVRCLTDAERDARRAESLDTDGSAAGVARQEAEARDFADKCAQRTQYGSAMLANLGTRDVVRDVDVLRSALGEAKLTYLGYSYGTRIGSSYAERFPANVRALVLDGAVDPEQDAVESLVAQGQGFGTAFTEYTRWCAQRQDCVLGTDPAKATDAYHDLVRPLIDSPVEVGDGRRLSYDDASIATIQALYSQESWETLNSGLDELRRNRGTTLMALADSYNERDRSGRYATTQDVFTAVRCVDDPPVVNKNEITAAEARYDQVAPFLDDGRPNGAALDACAFWPAPNTERPHLPTVTGLPPTLVVSTTNDPATPYAAGVNLAKALGGRLLTFEGTQHTVYLQGVSCVDTAGTDYLLEGTLPAEGTRCQAS